MVWLQNDIKITGRSNKNVRWPSIWWLTNILSHFSQLHSSWCNFLTVSLCSLTLVSLVLLSIKMENDQVCPIVLLHDIKVLTMCRVSLLISTCPASAPLPVCTISQTCRLFFSLQFQFDQLFFDNWWFTVDRLITSKDHASVQISIADVDANGRALSTSTTFAICGQVRSQGESDDSLNKLATDHGRA